MSQTRMVNMAFMAAALILWIVSARTFAAAFDFIRPEWDLALIGAQFRLSDLIGISVGVFGGIALWRHETVFRLAHEVAAETRKVTWPGQEETRVATIVVMVTTVIAALFLWAFDVTFSALSRLIYQV
jgi:preprotein translocase SecE subunit